MMRIRSVLLAALAVVLLPLAVAAHEFKAGDLTIGHPWARATAGGGANGAAFLSVANGGKTADRLIAAASPVAAKVELHTHLIEDGVMKMRPVAGIDIEPGAVVELKPGGFHVMLIGLTAPLKEGDSFPLELTFEKVGKVATTVKVESPAAGAEGMGGMHHQH